MHLASMATCVALAFVTAVVLKMVTRRKLGPHEDDLLEHGDAEGALRAIRQRDDRAHDIRVVAVNMGKAAAMCGALLAVVCGAVSGWPTLSAGARVIAAACVLVCLAIPTLSTTAPIRSEFALVRGIDPRALRPTRRAYALAAIRLAAFAWPLAVAAWAPSLPIATAELCVGYMLINVACSAVGAHVKSRLIAVDQPTPQLVARVTTLATRLGMRAPRLRVIRAKARKSACAYQVGWWPRARYVLVSDYLLDEMSEPEVDAILAHELAHARMRHALPRHVLIWACVLGGALLGIGIVGYDFNDASAICGALIMAGSVFRLKAIAIPQEIAADDLAVRVVGRSALTGALAHLAQVNAIKPDTDSGWDRRVGHPSILSRIARLEAAPPVSERAPAS